LLPFLLATFTSLCTPAQVSAEEAKAFGGSQASYMPSISAAASLNPHFEDISSISISTFQPSQFEARPLLQPDTELKGSVSVNEQVTSPTQLIGRLTSSALEKDSERELLERKARLHNQAWTRLYGRAKEMVQFATDYQGFESSSEGADVILEEKLKLKHHAAVELVRQKKADVMHQKMTCAVMQIAMGLGMGDEQKKQQIIESGRREIVPLVGDQEANQIVRAMTTWSRQLQVTESRLAHEPWDILTLQKKSKMILASSIREDDVVKSIEARLHKYNHRSTFARAAAKLIGTTTTIIALTPTFASPAAQAAEFIFVSCTGGPEEKKLLREVYLDRCFESRFERLNQEASLAVNNYNTAILTHNPVLYSCAQSLMEGLTDPGTASSIVSDSESVLDEASVKSFGNRI
jgi:hypothetical protein